MTPESAAAPVPVEPAIQARPSPPPVRGAVRLLTGGALLNGVILSLITTAVLSAWVLFGLDGFRYYTTPFGVRGYDAAHRVLRPSGTAGLGFGIAGALAMLVPFVYMLSKRFPRLRHGVNLKTWLEIHIFCGIVGPALVTYHTAFKFNGLVSVAYWSMMLVALSGFIGRYLYVRIPRTIRGVEVTEGELEARRDELADQLSWMVPAEFMTRLESLDDELRLESVRPTVAGFLLGGRMVRRRLRLVRRDLETAGSTPALVADVLDLIAERALLARRLTYLHLTKAMFEVWHVFHLPLVYVMFAIVSLHVALAVYMGYGPLR